MKFLGIDLNGVLDRGMVLEGKQNVTLLPETVVHGGLVRRPEQARGERWIGGHEARSTLSPTVLRQGTNYEFVSDLLSLALSKQGLPNDAHHAREPSGPSPEENSTLPVSDVNAGLEAALRALAGHSGGDRTTLVVPDTLSQEGQDRMLQLARSALPGERELLWRPVAALIGWAHDLSHDDLTDLDGATVAYVHLDAAAVSVSVLATRVDTVAGFPLLVPQRSGRGLSLGPFEVVKDAFEQIVLADLDGSQHDSVSVAALGADERPWRVLFGHKAQAALVPTQSGYLWLNETPPNAQIAHQALNNWVLAIQDQLEGVDADAILIDGAGAAVNLGDRTLGVAMRDELAQSSVPTYAITERTAALGGAAYGWRLAHGWPTYEDVLPHLRIVVKEARDWVWKDLVPDDQVVAGGQQYGPRTIEGFRVDKDATELKYAISRGDEPLVRQTITPLPFTTQRQHEVDLVVTQNPGQGSASVEVRPKENAEALGGKVFLRWDTMEETGLSPEAFLESYESDGALGYPDTSRFECHAMAWENYFVLECLEDLERLDADNSRMPIVLKQAGEALRSKLSIDWIKYQRPGGPTYGIFDSDGNIPADIVDRRPDVEHLIANTKNKLGEIYEYALSQNASSKLASELLRRSAIAGSWMYAQAPACSLDFARQTLSTHGTLPTLLRRNRQYGINVAGRAFSTVPDMQIAFSEFAGYYKQKNKLTNERMKAARQMLFFREDAPQALTLQMAETLAEAAVDVMAGEVQKRNLKHRFFNAAAMMVGLLRFRIVDADFLDPNDESGLSKSQGALNLHRQRPDDTHRSESSFESNVSKGSLIRQAVDVLHLAQDLSEQNSSGVKALLQEVEAYLEKRGTDTLLFTSLMERANNDE